VIRLHERHPTLWRFFIFKFARGEYLAIHLAIGLVISVVVLAVFGTITEDVVEGAPLTYVDVALLTGLSTSASPGLLAVLHVVASVGGPMTIAFVAAIVGIVFAARRNWLYLGGWLAAYAGGVALDIMLRRIIRRGELPLSPDLLNSELLAAMPTGHTVGAVVTFGLLAHFMIRRARSGPVRVLIVATTLTVLAAIVVARLFLGTSYLSSESVSVAAGVLWLASCISGLELAHFRRETPLNASA
jgi:hypothetical protein